MAIRSMTGYGQGISQVSTTRISIEMRTVNHRFAEYNIRTPREWSMLEDTVRQQVSKEIRRGRVDVFVNVERDSTANDIRVDWSFLDAVIGIERELSNRTGISFSTSDVRDWLKYPNVIRVESSREVTDEETTQLCLAVKDATREVVAMREREGERLADNLREKLASLRQYARDVQTFDREGIEVRTSKLKQRLDQLQTDVDADRLAQEVVFLVDRSAIDEEIVRLLIHIDAFYDALHSSEAVGRRFDFIVQEMHREVNTIGSKAFDSRIAERVVEMKVLVEQLREQVQNVE